MKKYLLYGVVVLIFAIAIVYFVYKFNDSSFRDNAMGNLFATLIGLIVGIPVALEINRYQQHRIEEKARKANEEEKRSKFKIYFERMEDELQHNEIQVERLKTVLSLSPRERKELWDFARAIVDAFAFEAYDAFYLEGFHLLLPYKLEAKIFVAYSELRRLFSNVTTAAYAHIFYHGYSTDGEAQMNKWFEDMKIDAERVRALVDETLDHLAEYHAVEEVS